MSERGRGEVGDFDDHGGEKRKKESLRFGCKWNTAKERMGKQKPKKETYHVPEHHREITRPFQSWVGQRRAWRRRQGLVGPIADNAHIQPLSIQRRGNQPVHPRPAREPRPTMHKHNHGGALLPASVQLHHLLRRLVAVLKDLRRATQRQETKQGLGVASRQSDGGD